MKDSVNLVFPKLHWAQEVIHSYMDEPSVRYRVASCGRRFGKTSLGIPECVHVALQGGKVWWVAPTFNNAAASYQIFADVAKQLVQVGVNVQWVKRDFRFTFDSGGSIRVVSAKNYDNLRGEGLDFVVLDEAAYMHPDVWQRVIMPMLWTTRGRALFISTACGRNWFYKLFSEAVKGKRLKKYMYNGSLRGEFGRVWAEGGDEAYVAFQFPSSANPLIPREDFRRDVERMSEEVYQREFLSAFTDEQSMVFVNVDECATSTQLDVGLPGHEYVIGVDLARTNDFSCFSVGDVAERRQVYLERHRDTNYETQINAIVTLVQRFNNAVVVIETNAMGDPLAEFLVKRGVAVEMFATRSQSKEGIIKDLALAFSHRHISILPHRVQLQELKHFEATLKQGGRVAYSAPVGEHDDTVMALALMWRGIRHKAAGVINIMEAHGLYDDMPKYKRPDILRPVRERAAL